MPSFFPTRQVRKLGFLSLTAPPSLLRFPAFCVPCRTSTAILCCQCSLPDLNRDPLLPVFPVGPQRPMFAAGPQLRASRPVLAAGPQPRSSASSAPQPAEECQNRCQKDCRKICQKKCQIDMPERMLEGMSEDM